MPFQMSYTHSRGERERMFLLRIINYVPFTTRCFALHGGNYHKNKPIYINIIIIVVVDIEWSERRTCALSECLKHSRVKFHCSTVKFFIARTRASFSANNRMFKRLFSSISTIVNTTWFGAFFMLIVIIIFYSSHIDHRGCLFENIIFTMWKGIRHYKFLFLFVAQHNRKNKRLCKCFMLL